MKKEIETDLRASLKTVELKSMSVVDEAFAVRKGLENGTLSVAEAKEKNKALGKVNAECAKNLREINKAIRERQEQPDE